MKTVWMRFYPYLIFVSASLILVTVWFRNWNLLGGGESFIPFYNTQRMLELIKTPWVENNLGIYLPHAVINIPFYFFFTQLGKLLVYPFLVQASFFFVLLVLTLSSIYLLCKEVLSKVPTPALILASFYYLFNPYSLVNIWNRFLLNMMLFYAILPLGLLLYIRSLSSSKLIYPVSLGLLSVVFSFAFSSPGHVIVFWFLLALITLFHLPFRSEVAIFRKFAIAFGIWLLFNFWWYSQQIFFSYSQAFQGISDLYFTPLANQDVLNSLSGSLGKLSNLLIMHHGYFFSRADEFPSSWPFILSNSISVFVQWSIVIGALAVAIKNRSIRWVRFFLGLFILGVFAAKGNNLPLGEIFNFLFQHVMVMQFFRNPFEKLGLLIPLALTPLIALLISEVAARYYLRVRRFPVVPYLSSSLVILGLFGFPFWTGLVFTTSVPPSNDPRIGVEVVVPNYYPDVSRWLEANNQSSRYLALPLGEEGIYYNWEKGYSGVELSSLLLLTSGISNVVEFPFFRTIGKDLEVLFVKYAEFYKAASVLNLRYLLFRPDIDFRQSHTTDPEIINKILNARVASPEAKLKPETDYGPIKIYRFNPEVYQEKIYLAKGLILSDKLGHLTDLFVGNAQKGDVIISSSHTDLSQGWITDRAVAQVFHNRSFYELPGPEFPYIRRDESIFPHVANLPSSWKFPLILIKEQVEIFAKLNEEERVNKRLQLLGKRLIEIERSLTFNDLASAQKSFDLYASRLDGVLDKVSQFSKTRRRRHEQAWHGSEMLDVFSSHLYLLNNFAGSGLNNDQQVTRLADHLRERASEIRIMPSAKLIKRTDLPLINRLIYEVEVAREGEFEILIPTTDYYPLAFNVGDGVALQIDDQLYRKEILIKDNFVSFGKIKLTKGLHVLSFNRPDSTSLIVAAKEIIIEAIDRKKELTVPFTELDPYSQYEITFDYWVPYGDGLGVVVALSSDLPSTEKRDNNFYTTKVAPNDYWYDYQQFGTVIVPKLNADSAKVIFSVKPWNNCEKIYASAVRKCDNPGFKKGFDRPSKVIVKNLKLVPRVPEEIYLTGVQPKDIATTGEINFEKISATQYQVQIKGATGPYLLVFSEIFDPNWKLLKSTGEEFKPQHILVNGYANAWWIEEIGDLDLVIEFWPQKLLQYATWISLLSMTGLLIILLLTRLRR